MESIVEGSSIKKGVQLLFDFRRFFSLREKPHAAVSTPKTSISDIHLLPVGKAPVSPVSSRHPCIPVK